MFRSAQQSLDSQYNLRGLNMIDPDQIVDDTQQTAGQSPYTINSRMRMPEDDPRTSIHSRKGVGFYTVPVGEALDTQNTTTTDQSDESVNYLGRVAQMFTAGASKRLTKVELLLKTNTSTDIILVEVYEDVAGNLGNRIAASGIQPQSITTGYTYVEARFPQGPLLTNGNNYWIVVYSQDELLSTDYHLSRTTAGSDLMVSVDGGVTYNATTGSVNYKVYQADDAPVLWHHRFVKTDGTKQTLFAVGGASPAIYKVDNEVTGAVSSILTGLSTSATRYRHAEAGGKLYIVNGYDDMIKWDGTTITRSTHTVDFKVPANIVLWNNRFYFYNKDDPTRVYFTNLFPDMETVPSVNFFYVKSPTSPDPITGWTPFQDQLVIFTKESKWLAIGDGSLGGTRLSQSPGGTKGAVSQEAISNGETRIYFISIDGGAYYYNGAVDIAIGDRIQPEYDEVYEHGVIDSVITDREWRVYYKRLGDSEHRRMFLYDLRFREWFLDTETYTRLPEVRTLENNELIEASSVYGALFFGEAQDANLGAPIDFKYWTNYKKYTSGIAKDRVRKFRAIFSTPDRTFTVNVGKDADFDNDATYKRVVLNTSGILYDSGETYGSDTAYYGRGSRIADPKVSLSGRAKNTQYRFEKYGAYTPVGLYGYESIVKSGRPR